MPEKDCVEPDCLSHLVDDPPVQVLVDASDFTFRPTPRIQMDMTDAGQQRRDLRNALDVALGILGIHEEVLGHTINALTEVFGHHRTRD